MITVDTNVLVRILVNDPKEAEQVNAARSCISKSGTIFIPQIVQVETVWVLCSGYKLKKKEVLTLLEHLVCNSTCFLEHEERFSDALAMYREDNADFSDHLILATARENNCEVVTFDKSFAKSSKVVLIQTES